VLQLQAETVIEWVPQLRVEKRQINPFFANKVHKYSSAQVLAFLDTPKLLGVKYKCFYAKATIP
jgi:hypothetical protein